MCFIPFRTPQQTSIIQRIKIFILSSTFGQNLQTKSKYVNLQSQICEQWIRILVTNCIQIYFLYIVYDKNLCKEHCLFIANDSPLTAFYNNESLSLTHFEP